MTTRWPARKKLRAGSIAWLFFQIAASSGAMKQLVTTTDIVRLSFLCALLRGSGIVPAVFDANIAALEGGIGAFPWRVMVPDARYLAAKTLLEDAGQFYDD